MLLLMEELRAARVEQCAVGFHGHAVAADQSHVEVQHFAVVSHESHEVGLKGRGRGGFRYGSMNRKGRVPNIRKQWHEARVIGSEEWHRGEGVPVRGITQAELPVLIVPTGEHRAVLCQDHRVAPATNHLLGDLAVREGRHRGEGVPLRGIAQAELPFLIVPAGEHSARERRVTGMKAAQQ